MRPVTDGQRIEVLYLSAVVSAEQFRAMKEARRPQANEVTYGMIESGQNFGSLIQDGLLQNPAVNLTSLVGRSVDHRFYEGRFWPRVRQRVSDRFVIDHLSFPNVPVLRQLWLAAGFAWHAALWRLRTRRAPRRVFIADGAYISALPGVLAVLGRRVAKLAIFADIYAYMGDVRDASDRDGLLYRIVRRVAQSTYGHLDGLVLLTEAMNSAVNPRSKPHIVMEGLVDRRMADQQPKTRHDEQDATVLYAGTLRREYGLDRLIEGFTNYDNPNAQLLLYGAGDFVPQVLAAAERDPRIQYHHTVPVPAVVEAEQRATLLVNPRPATEEFTRYSFPSKNMEYMVSGTPVLTTRLPGMPTEYYEHVYTIDGDTSQAVTEALERTLALPAETLRATGQRARDFVLTQKNNKIQAQRILDLAGDV